MTLSRILIASVLWTGSYLPAGAQEVPAQPNAEKPAIADPLMWAKLPSPKEWTRHFPKAAKKAKLDGNVVVECIVADDIGHVKCRTISETPEGLGYGDATILLIETYALVEVKKPTDVGRAIKLRQVWVP